MGSTDAWAELDARVLAALDDTHPRAITELRLDLQPEVVLALLDQNIRCRRIAVRRGTSGTTYTITEAGRRHLAANTKAMA